MARLLLLVLAVVACKGDGKKDVPSTEPAAAPAAPSPDARARSVELPQVSGRGVEPARDDGPIVVVSKTALIAEGKLIAAITNGQVDPSEKEGGALGLKIAKLSHFLGTIPRADTLRIAADRQTPYRLLVEVLFSAKSPPAEWKRFDLLAEDGARTVRIPIALPERAPAAGYVARRTPGADLARQIEQTARTKAKVRATIEEVGDADSPATAVARAIQAKYLAGIKRCYTALLKEHPDAGGKITLSITISAVGRATAATARGFHPSVDRCIEGQMRNWRFPAPDEEMTVTTTLQLVAEGGPPPASEPPPASAPPSAPPPPAMPPEDMPLSVVVSVTPSEIVLWSISGLEGTLANPKLRLSAGDPDALPKLEAALAEIVERRWRGKERPEPSREIVFMADASIPMQRVVEIMAAIRPAFPDLLLSSGFE